MSRGVGAVAGAWPLSSGPGPGWSSSCPAPGTGGRCSAGTRTETCGPAPGDPGPGALPSWGSADLAGAGKEAHCVRRLGRAEAEVVAVVRWSSCSGDVVSAVGCWGGRTDPGHPTWAG